MKTILAPTDFSTSSINAVFYAADLALAIQAKLILFHAIPFPIAISEISVPGDFVDDMMEAGQTEMDDLYNKILKRTRDRIPVSKVIKIGAVELEMEKTSLDEKPLAIVLSIKPGKTLERALMGSSIFHIMNHVGFPALIIPDHITYTGIKNIGMACDLEKVDDRMPMDTVKEWLSLFNAQLEIINITAPKTEFKASRLSDSITIQNQLSEFKPHFHFLKGKHITEELDDFIKVHPLDLLMVFPGKHGIFTLFHKKKSKNIVTHIQLPILSIHDMDA